MEGVNSVRSGGCTKSVILVESMKSGSCMKSVTFVEGVEGVEGVSVLLHGYNLVIHILAGDHTPTLLEIEVHC